MTNINMAATSRNPYQQEGFSLQQHDGSSLLLDDDGRLKRSGTFVTASAHILTAVIGPGLLSLPWAIAQLGWVAGPAVMILFSIVTVFTSSLLASCYRTGDVVNGKRNYTYMDAVHSYLGGWKVKFCGIIQYLNLFGVAIGYTIGAALSMMAVQKQPCLHTHGGAKAGDSSCKINSNPYMIAFGVVQSFLSQIPGFDQLRWLTVVAAVMSFTYSTIALALSITKLAENRWKIRGNVTGVPIGTITQDQKIWRSFQSLGDIAFAYSFLVILIEIQDTIKSPPSESKTMKKATLLSVIVTTIFYMLCGCFGYAAFGNNAPGNLLTDFGYFNPYWLLDIANIAIIIHLVGAYQVFVQPLYAFVEKQAINRFPPGCTFLTKEILIPLIPGLKPYKLNIFRLTWRTGFVILTTLISMLIPCINDVVGLLGVIGFWSLNVFLPVEMYIVQMKIGKWSTRWISLQILSMSCLVISMVGAAGSIYSISHALKVYKLFKTRY